MIAKNRWMILATMMFAAVESVAGTGTGKVGSVLVGRLGYQVFVQILNPVYNGFACGTPSSSWTFAFSTQNSGGKDMLATVLTAKAQGLTLVFVGNGTCNQDPGLEDVGYIITAN